MGSNNVRVVFGADEVLIGVPAGEAAWPVEQARLWLDDQFNALGCEPVRPTGKVLTVDRLVAIAEALGPRGFEQDEKVRADYARAALAALARPEVRVDVFARKVSY